MGKFAQGTPVKVEKSRAEIERMIVRYGATSTAFMNGPDRAMIVFEAKDRRVMFRLPLTSQDDKRYLRDGRNHLRSQAERMRAWEADCRQRWRALALVIKAKLEAVESGITSFEDEFMPYIVMPDGKTVADHVKPTIARVYDGGHMLPLLPAPGTN